MRLRDTTVCLGWQLRRYHHSLMWGYGQFDLKVDIFPGEDQFYVSEEVANLAKQHLGLASDWEARDIWGWPRD